MKPEYPDMQAALRATPNAIFAIQGGTNQHSIFHRTYLQLRNQLLSNFQQAQGHAAMKEVYDTLIWRVENDYHGKFYKRTASGKWTEMSQKQKRRKVSAAFRDESLRVRNRQAREEEQIDDDVSIMSETTLDSFDIVMRMLDSMMDELNDPDDDDDDANEPIAIDFDGIVGP